MSNRRSRKKTYIPKCKEDDDEDQNREQSREGEVGIQPQRFDLVRPSEVPALIEQGDLGVHDRCYGHGPSSGWRGESLGSIKRSHRYSCRVVSFV